MDDHTTVSRRTVLRGVAGAAGVGALAGVPTAAAAPSFGGYLDNTSNYDGLVDETGSSEVTIEVGVSGNNGPNGFGPAAVRVDPGTTVVWEWTGNGGHNVVAEDGAFESELLGKGGHTFEQTFDSEGVVKYYCNPHKVMGMKGVVVVGEPGVGGGSDEGEDSSNGPDYGEWFRNTGNFEETVDRTGQEEVMVTVGARGNNGPFAFDPPAVRVDPGTTIVWKWSGEGGSHNVVAEDGSFESDLIGDAGHTFEHTFDSDGVYEYACTPHSQMGMRGVIVVGGGGSANAGSNRGRLLAIGGGVGLAGAIFGLFGAGARERSDE
jgi:halocyanin-like protein